MQIDLNQSNITHNSSKITLYKDQYAAEGFQQIPLTITQLQKQHLLNKDNENQNQLNQIISSLLPAAKQISPNPLRPQDFIPRTVYINLKMTRCPKYLQKQYKTRFQEYQQIQLAENSNTNQNNLIKGIKFESLSQKYQHNSHKYLLVYKRFLEDDQDFTHRIINLKELIVFDPKQYAILRQSQINQQKLTYRIGFNSNFESGNLLYAYKRPQKDQFDLILQYDTNTRGYSQWFFFSFRNGYKTHTIKFNIVNLIKKNSLFANNQYIKPIAFSLKVNEQQINENKQSSKQNKKIRGWSTKNIKNVRYYRNNVKRFQTQNSEFNKNNYYSLSFQYTFQHEDDQVYFALTKPYTYSKLILFLTQIEENFKSKNQNQIMFEKKRFCYTLSNNSLPYVLIGDPLSGKKSIVIIFARQHPGENVSSFLVQNFIRYISNLKNSVLLTRMSFIIFPMVNVDGVIYGNFRTGISGFDFNRQWLQPNKILNPEIYQIKNFLIGLLKLKQKTFILDLHGHSRKLGCFLYGNPRQQDPINEKIFSVLLHLNIGYPKFIIQECTYNMTLDKLKTARIVLKKLGFPDVFTLQTSFFGYPNEHKTFLPYKNQDFYEMAKSIIESIDIYLHGNNSQQYLKCLNYISSNKSAFEKKKSNTIGQVEIFSGSDSQPQADQLPTIQREQKLMTINIKGKNKQRKTKSMRLYSIINDREIIEYEQKLGKKTINGTQSNVLNSQMNKKIRIQEREQKKKTYLEEIILKKKPPKFVSQYYSQIKKISDSQSIINNLNHSNKNISLYQPPPLTIYPRQNQTNPLLSKIQYQQYYKKQIPNPIPIIKKTCIPSLSNQSFQHQSSGFEYFHYNSQSPSTKNTNTHLQLKIQSKPQAIDIKNSLLKKFILKQNPQSKVNNHVNNNKKQKITLPSVETSIISRANIRQVQQKGKMNKSILYLQQINKKAQMWTTNNNGMSRFNIREIDKEIKRQIKQKRNQLGNEIGKPVFYNMSQLSQRRQ